MRRMVIALVGAGLLLTGCQFAIRQEPSLEFMTGAGKLVGGPETAEGRRFLRAKAACVAKLRTDFPGRSDYVYARLAGPLTPGMRTDLQVGPLMNALVQCLAEKKYQAVELASVKSRSSG